jgi:acetyl esterase/lipase
LACQTFPPPKSMLVIPVTITPGPAQIQLESEMKQVINLLGPGLDGLDVRVEPVIAEWQGPQRIPHDINHSKLSPEGQYEELARDTKDRPVILYFHGGAYIVGSPDTHRALTLRIANGCNGRILAVRYRLAPEHPFPAALLDALAAYMYLVDPPKGALHEAVDPSKIIIAGDSAGVRQIWCQANNRVV